MSRPRRKIRWLMISWSILGFHCICEFKRGEAGTSAGRYSYIDDCICTWVLCWSPKLELNWKLLLFSIYTVTCLFFSMWDSGWRNLYKTSHWRNFAFYFWVWTTWEHPLGIPFREFHTIICNILYVILYCFIITNHIVLEMIF